MYRIIVVIPCNMRYISLALWERWGWWRHSLGCRCAVAAIPVSFLASLLSLVIALRCVQFLLQVPVDFLEMHKVAKSSTGAFCGFVLSATG